MDLTDRIVELGLRADAFFKGMARAVEKVDEFAKGFEQMGEGVNNVALGIAE